MIDWQAKHYNGVSSIHTPALVLLLYPPSMLCLLLAYLCCMLALLLYKNQIIAVSSVTNPFMLFTLFIVLFLQADDEQKRTVKKLIYAAKVRDFEKLVGIRGETN